MSPEEKRLILEGKSFYNAQFRTFKFAGRNGMNSGAKKYDLVESKSRKRVHVRLPEQSLDDGVRAPNVRHEQTRAFRITTMMNTEQTKEK
jgi:hypothetical protein